MPLLPANQTCSGLAPPPVSHPNPMQPPYRDARKTGSACRSTAQQSLNGCRNILRTKGVGVRTHPLLQVGRQSRPLRPREHGKPPIARPDRSGVSARPCCHAYIQNRKRNQVRLLPRVQTHEHVCRDKILERLRGEQWKDVLVLPEFREGVAAPCRATKMPPHILTLQAVLVVRDPVIARIRNIGKSSLYGLPNSHGAHAAQRLRRSPLERIGRWVRRSAGLENTVFNPSTNK